MSVPYDRLVIVLGLTSQVRRLVVGNTVSAIGTGLVLPITLIYLHRVRHIPLPTTGLLLAIPGIAGLVAVPVAGSLMDRVGARRVLATCMLLLAAAQVGLAAAHTADWAAPALLIQGIALGPTFPAFGTLLGGLTSGGAQQRAFAVNFTMLNAGIGIGGLIGGAVVGVAHPGTFQLMFLGNAAATTIAGLLVLSVPEPARSTPHGEHEKSGGYRQVFGDRILRRLIVLTLLLAMTGYAALDSGLPAYANVEAGVSARVIALSLAANTLMIVIAQLPVLRVLEGRRRTHAIAAVGVVWAGSWLLFGCCTLPGSQGVRDALVLTFAALFGLGETFMAPSVTPLINSLAPEHVRGRANAMSSGMYSVAFVISPAISAAFIAAGLGGVWIALLAVGGVAVTGTALLLTRRLTPAQDIAQSTPVPEAEFVAT